jgi:translation initiation factor 2 subunit 2
MEPSENINIIFQEPIRMSNNILQESDIALSEIFTKENNKKSNQEDKINIGYDDILAEFDLKEKKKKKKKNKKIEDNITKLIHNLNNDPPTYSYEFLLNKFYDNFQDKYNFQRKNKNTLKIPIVHRVGSKKSSWLNFKECCKCLNREEHHLQIYTQSELSAESNIDGGGHLVLKGIYNQKNIEIILKKYVSTYVQCQMCKGIDTFIKKDTVSRLSFLECYSCRSARSLQSMDIKYKTNVKI